MSKYRFKTEEEFKADGLWNEDYDCPNDWCEEGDMNKFMGEEIPDKFNKAIEAEEEFRWQSWVFQPCDCTLHILSEEEEQEVFKQVKSLITKEKMETKAVKNTEKKERKANPVGEKFVFMDKTINILNVGFDTCKNVILYGPGE